MKEVEIKLVSKDTIIPSSPTPQHLFHYQLSSLDQTAYPVYNPLVFFYSSNNRPNEFDLTDLSYRLKTSLSETLARFYPLAGQLRGNDSIECNDHGCVYLETRVGSRLSDVIQNLNPHELRKFVPFVLHDMGEFNLGVQFNVFECGSVAIGVCFSHKVGDGFSVFLFTKAWAAICRGEVDVPYPNFISASIFPPNEVSAGCKPQVLPYGGNITKRFVFESDTINAIKAKYSKAVELIKAGERPPSRVEALTAFIWTRFIASTQVHPCPEKTYIVSSAVNLRSKLKPPPPEHCSGNIYALAVTVLPDGEFLDLIPKMRESARKINKEFVEKHGNGETYVTYLRKTLDVVHLAFTSLCRFPIYDMDFGWGKPMWVGFPAWTFKDLIVFVDTKSGDGIEAYITLSKEDMAKFENDEKFRACLNLIV